jgi:hypothetical protein
LYLLIGNRFWVRGTSSSNTSVYVDSGGTALFYVKDDGEAVIPKYLNVGTASTNANAYVSIRWFGSYKSSIYWKFSILDM